MFQILGSSCLCLRACCLILIQPRLFQKGFQFFADFICFHFLRLQARLEPLNALLNHGKLTNVPGRERLDPFGQPVHDIFKFAEFVPLCGSEGQWTSPLLVESKRF